MKIINKTGIALGVIGLFITVLSALLLALSHISPESFGLPFVWKLRNNCSLVVLFSFAVSFIGAMIYVTTAAIEKRQAH